MRKRKLSLRTEGTVHEFGKRREIVLEFDPATPDLISVRASGMKTRYTITTGGLYVLLAQRQVEAELRERRKARRSRR